MLAVMLSALCGYMPDDGTQGYTPYFYKMDVPVRVKNTISYGRAWQLLRSRGAGSNATGPCDPFQLASSCNARRQRQVLVDLNSSSPICLANARLTTIPMHRVSCSV